MSEKAQQVLKRIRDLQRLTLEHGIITTTDQVQTLLTLDGADLFQVAEKAFPTPLKYMRGVR